MRKLSLLAVAIVLCVGEAVGVRGRIFSAGYLRGYYGVLARRVSRTARTKRVIGPRTPLVPGAASRRLKQRELKMT